MKKRLLCILLTIVMALALLPVQALAAPVSCELMDKGITFTWRYYVVYRYHGEVYNSNETDSQTNYEAWSHMSADDKMKVLRHFSGFTSQLRGQFANADELLDYGLEKTGWRRLRDTFNKKMAAKYFPALDAFYGEVGQFELPYDAETYLSAEEVQNYQKLRKEYDLIRSSGKEAYDRLVKLKNTQITNAVSAISSELIQIIMDNVTGGKPGGELDDLLDSTVEMLDENLKITETLKEYTGLKTPEDVALEFVDKYTGEEDRIDTGEAVELINLIDRLMTAQEKHATVCMEKCELRAEQLKELGAVYNEAVTQRRADKEAAEAKRQDAYREAVKQNVNLVDLTPGISVKRDDYDSNHDGTLDADEQENYRAACLSAAENWRADQWKWATDNLHEFWRNNYENEALGTGDPRYFDTAYFTQWRTKYDGTTGKALPNEFYNNAFSALRNRLGEDAPVFTDTPGSFLGVWESLFTSRTDYREVLSDYEQGYNVALDELNRLKGELQTARETYLSAWEDARNEYVTTVIPWRTLAFNLTHQLEGEWYGDWRFPTEDAEKKWQDFEQTNERYGEYFLRGAEQIDALVPAIDAEIARVTSNRELFVQGRDAYYNSLPGYFKQCAEVQEELEDGLAIANHCLSELASMKEKYPDWVTQYNVRYCVNYIVGGVIVPDEILNMILGDRRYFTGEESYDEQVAKLENTLAPKLGDWLRRERELLNQLRRAEKLLGEASGKRIQDIAQDGWREAELINLNSLPGVNHGVRIVPMLDLIMSSDPYYHYYNVLNYYDENDVQAIPWDGCTPQLSALYDDMIGNGSPMRMIRARYARLLEERSDLLRVAKAGKLYETNDFYSEMGYSADYFSKNYGSTVNWNDSRNIYYWAWHGSLRPWDLYSYANDVIKPVADAIRAVNNGGAYNPVGRLEKGGASAAGEVVLAEAAPDAVLETGGTMRFSVTAVGEDTSVEPSYPNVYWSSSDESIASVDEKGTITGRLPGTVTITATAEDSPRSNPITVSFTLQVRSGSVTEISQLGDGIYALAPRAARSDAQVRVSGVLGINGDEFVSGTLIAAAYANGRFLGCAASPFRIQGSETMPIDCALPLASADPADVTVKLFLVESAGYRPQTGYSPVLLTLSEG